MTAVDYLEVLVNFSHWEWLVWKYLSILLQTTTEKRTSEVRKNQIQTTNNAVTDMTLN